LLFRKSPIEKFFATSDLHSSLTSTIDKGLFKVYPIQVMEMEERDEKNSEYLGILRDFKGKMRLTNGPWRPSEKNKYVKEYGNSVVSYTMPCIRCPVAYEINGVSFSLLHAYLFFHYYGDFRSSITSLIGVVVPRSLMLLSASSNLSLVAPA
jgi:hypothetical protein